MSTKMQRLMLECYILKTRAEMAERERDNAIDRAKKRSGNCRWEQNEDGQWETACGGTWEINEGAPAENGMGYCPRCGRLLETALMATEGKEIMSIMDDIEQDWADRLEMCQRERDEWKDRAEKAERERDDWKRRAQIMAKLSSNLHFISPMNIVLAKKMRQDILAEAGREAGKETENNEC